MVIKQVKKVPAIDHDLTLIDSSDENALFTIPGWAAPPARQSRFTPTLVNTLVVRHANDFSPLSAEINDEPGVPNASGVPQVVHSPGESDTDSVDFHAIHTPAGSDGGEEGDDDTRGHWRRSSARLIHPLKTPCQLVLMRRWQGDSGVWTKSPWTPSRGCLMRVVPFRSVSGKPPKPAQQVSQNR